METIIGIIIMSVLIVSITGFLMGYWNKKEKEEMESDEEKIKEQLGMSDEEEIDEHQFVKDILIELYRKIPFDSLRDGYQICFVVNQDIYEKYIKYIGTREYDITLDGLIVYNKLNFFGVPLYSWEQYLDDDSVIEEGVEEKNVISITTKKGEIKIIE